MLGNEVQETQISFEQDRIIKKLTQHPMILFSCEEIATKIDFPFDKTQSSLVDLVTRNFIHAEKKKGRGILLYSKLPPVVKTRKKHKDLIVPTQVFDSKVITVNLSEDTIQRINKILERGNFPSRSELVRVALRKYIKRIIKNGDFSKESTIQNRDHLLLAFDMRTHPMRDVE